MCNLLEVFDCQKLGAGASPISTNLSTEAVENSL
jgi:hypothetical protein